MILSFIITIHLPSGSSYNPSSTHFSDYEKKHYAGQVFKIAANSLYKSKSPLVDFYRRIKAKAGAGKAVVATKLLTHMSEY